MLHVNATFRPEFLNRLDEIILFHRLTREHINSIVKIQLKSLRHAISLQNITLEFDVDAINWLGDKGYDMHYGARPLKRVIQREVQNILAKRLLSGEFTSGDIIYLTVNNNNLIITKKNIV
jgi:ATP-dependent Clp protease ATP-binding subunit ClpB